MPEPDIKEQVAQIACIHLSAAWDDMTLADAEENWRRGLGYGAVGSDGHAEIAGVAAGLADAIHALYAATLERAAEEKITASLQAGRLVRAAQARARAAEAQVEALKEALEAIDTLASTPMHQMRPETIEAIQRIVRNALASSAPARAVYPEWRPIETAPRDGTHVILAFGQDTVSEGWWEDNDGDARPWKFVDTGLLGSPFHKGEGINGCRDGRYGPTHWLPLPARGESK